MENKTVRYSEIEPFSDRLAFYKDELYLTEEDLKLKPEFVTLIPLDKVIEEHKRKKLKSVL